jgi:peptidoglycan hydrolase-like protein with peptidoglycan-binding domain
LILLTGGVLLRLRASGFGWGRQPVPRPAKAARIQHELGRLGFFSGSADGDWTGQTRAAVARFRRAAHLPGEGTWSRDAEAALRRMLRRRG